MTNSIFNSPFTFGRPQFASEEERLRWELGQAQAVIARTQKKPVLIGTVGCLLPGQRGMVYFMGFSQSLELPDGCPAGAQVTIAAEHNSVLAVLPDPVTFGPVTTVAGLTGHDILYDQGTAQASAFIPSTLSARVGDKVQLDPTGRVVLRNIGNEEPTDYVVHKSPGVSWDDIGGLDDAKQAIREAIEYPIKYAETYRAYGQRPACGVLLEGPPGCGKTLLGKAVATSLSTDGNSNGFIYVKAAEVLNKYVGASESAIRGLFSRARAHQEKTGDPAVLFIDEADAVLGRRDSGQGFSMALTQTTVTTFLAEMDGLEDSGCFVLLATNRPDSLDPAVLRDGRMDVHVHVGRPNEQSVRRILELALRKVSAAGASSLAAPIEQLIDRASVLLHSDEATLYELRFKHGSELVRLRDALNGALVTGIIERATDIALRRDRGGDSISGIALADIEEAVRGRYKQLYARTQPELIDEKCDALGGARPISVEKRAGRLE